MATTALDGSNGLIRNFDFNTPITGFSYTVPSGVVGTIFTPAGTLLTGTIIMTAAPADGMTVSLSSTQAITTLTLSPNTGQSILNAIVTFAVGATASYVYRLSNTTWYKIST